MRKFLVLALSLFIVTSVHAQVYKCTGADGKHQFSDVPCREAEKTEIVRDRTAAVSVEEQQAARQRTIRMQEEITAKEKEEEVRIAQGQAEQEREAKAVKKGQDDEEAKRTEAVSNCVRDVEQRGASQDIKAEMIAACRTAGASQGASGVSADAVRECVKNVERTGASEKEKARQVAICHGAEVEPRPYRHRSQ